MPARTAGAPLRRVLRCVKLRILVSRPNKRPFEDWHQRELLECGHLFAPPMGLHGTTIGDKDSRRCIRCRAGEPADCLRGWEEL